MRISGRISRATAFTAAALTAVTAVAGCGGSSQPTTTPIATQAAFQGASDIQLLSALTLTPSTLAAAFPGDTWAPWAVTDADKAAIGVKALRTCQADLDGSKVTPSKTGEVFFKLDSAAATAAPAAAKKGATATPPPAATTPEWVGSVAAVYKTPAEASQALADFSGLSGATDLCGSPDSWKGKGFVRGPGHTGATWYGSQPMSIVYDIANNRSISAVAQVRGRFVIVVYARGGEQLSNGYYTLDGTTDTTAAADAATQLLGQLTDAAVSSVG